MRIVFLQHTFNPTTMGWVRGLEERGHEVLTIVERDSEPAGGWPDDLDVEIVPDAAPWVSRLLSRLLRGRKGAVHRMPNMRLLWRCMRDSRADVAIVKVYSVRNAIALVMALFLRVRRVAWIEQVPPPNIEWRILRRLGVLPRRMFTALDPRPGGIADPLDPPAHGMPVITYAPLIPAPTERATLVGRALRVLTVAAFWDPEHKRPTWTLRAAVAAGLADGRVEFTFAGLGHECSESLLELRALVSEFELGELVDIQVNRPYRTMGELYAAHDVLVLPSAWEQFGMVVPEAMAHGMAVIASDCVGSVGCIVPDVTGKLFRTDSLDDLAGALAWCAAHPEEVTRMGAAGRAFIEEHASPALTAELIERFALSQSRARAGTRTRR